MKPVILQLSRWHEQQHWMVMYFWVFIPKNTADLPQGIDFQPIHFLNSPSRHDTASWEPASTSNAWYHGSKTTLKSHLFVTLDLPSAHATTLRMKDEPLRSFHPPWPFVASSRPPSPWIAEELGLLALLPPDQPLPEGGMDKHPGTVSPLNQEDWQVVHTLLEVLPVQCALQQEKF